MSLALLSCWFLSTLSVSTAQDCAVEGASYGHAAVGKDSVRYWADVVGVACADSGDESNRCYLQASAWSTVAIEHGNRPVENAEECHALCEETNECEVWTYWPEGIGVVQETPICDVCPRSEGGTISRSREYCYEDECGLCGDFYDFFAFSGVEEGEDYTCADVLGVFRDVGCCVYSEEAKQNYRSQGACELLSAATANDRVLSYHGGGIVTGPKDCQETKWLPFLETANGPAGDRHKLVIDYEEEGFCNPCPVAYGLALNREKEFEDEDGTQTCGNAYDYVVAGGVDEPCEDIATWMRFTSECCDWSAVVDGVDGVTEVDHEEEGFCNPCPSAYGFTLHREREFEGEDGVETCGNAYDFITAGFLPDVPCDDLADWMLYTSFCCTEPQEPTPAPTVDYTPHASDGRKCWVDKHSYGIKEDGACADADIITVYATNMTIELGKGQGWWKDGIEVLSYGEEVFNVTDCQQACIENANCGGWEFRQGSCLLKSNLNCTPTLARNEVLNSIAGVSGCVDANSESSQENSAVDTRDLWFLECDVPRCTEPLSYGGFFAGDTYVGQGCFYKQYTPDELYGGCARDRWIVINGGSNSLSFFIQMVKLFAPIPGKPPISFDETFEYSIIDIVLEGGSLPIRDRNSPGILHINLKKFCEIDSSLPCEEDSLGFQGGTADWRAPYLDALHSALAEAPYENGATRITLVVGQIWNNAEATLNAVGGEGAANGWENANVIFYGQSMVWYPCNIEGWCELPELGESTDEMIHKYRSDLVRLMEVGRETCATDRFDCFFATHAYGSSLGERARRMISILDEVTSAHEWAHFIDYNGFVTAEEVVDGHTTPAMFLPVHAMIWNTVCGGPDTGCPEAISATPPCWKDCAGRGGAQSCGRCDDEDWICMNERQCDTEKLDPVPWEVATVRPPGYGGGQSSIQCFDAEQIGMRYMELVKDINREDTCFRRIWCGSVGAGWAIGISALLAGLAAVLVPMHLAKQKEDEKVSNAGKSEESPTSEDGEAPSTQDIEEQLTAVTTNECGDSAAVVQSQKSVPPKKEYLNSLGVARLLASQHIVVGHLYAKGAIANEYFYQWGYTWVPWFFVLSGYVLTHARLNSSDPTKVDSPLNHVAKRLSTIFPMYALGVFLAMIIRIAKNFRLPSIDVLIGQSFLLQSWVPQWTEEALLSQCWFLSGMLVYWTIFGWLYKRLRSLSLNWTFALIAFVCFLPWLTIIVPVLDDDIETTWYKAHRWGQMDSSADLWTVMLKFHPIFYFHVFTFGILLAVLRHHLKDESNQSRLATCLRALTQCGAIIGYTGLILVFTVEEMQPTSYKLSARLSVLLPLQGVMMLGLSPLPHVIADNGFQDPLAILFSFAPAWLGDVSYCQYVLQFAMYELFPRARVNNASFFLYLWGAAILSYKLFHEPAAKFWRSRLSKNSLTTTCLLLVPPVGLAVILGIAKGTYDPSSSGAPARGSTQPVLNTTNSTNFTLLAPFVRVGPEAVDLKLNWTIENDVSTGMDSMLINPSVLFLEDGNGGIQWVRAARAHALWDETAEGSYQGESVTEQALNFQSLIMLRSEPFAGDLSAGFDDESISQWGLDGILPLTTTASNLVSHVGKDASWSNLCEPSPSYNSANKWLVRKLVSGPEDPKLFKLPPSSHAAHDDGEGSWGLTFSSFPPSALLSEESLPEECKWTDEAVMQMYLASDGQALASGQKALGVRLDYGRRTDTEKNWIAFTHEDHLYFIYSVEPHVVVHVRSTDGASVKQYETSSPELEQIAQSVYAIRGSATAVKYSQDEYLALLHTYDPAYGYSTAAYTFQAEPPFAVKRISKPLPLQGHSFPSSLVLQSDKVIVGYGEADKSSRALVMSRNHLEKQFDWCSS